MLHDLTRNKQTLLQGHCNPITSVVVSDDGKWLVTSDTGLDSMVIVWEAATGTPVKTIFQSQMDAVAGCANSGVVAVAMSPNARYLATLSSTTPQVLGLWDWAALPSIDTPDAPPTLPFVYATSPTADMQLSVVFDPSAKTEGTALMTTGESRVVFWHWDPEELPQSSLHSKDGTGASKKDGASVDKEEGGSALPPSKHKLHFYAPPIVASEFKHSLGSFTTSIYLPHSSKALSATVDGDVVLWDVGLEEEGLKATDRKAVKALRLHEHGAINALVATDSHIVTGGEDGFVRFFDFSFHLVAWFEELAAGPITSLSFIPELIPIADETDMMTMGDSSRVGVTTPSRKTRTSLALASVLGGISATASLDAKLDVPDFVLGTADGLVLQVHANQFGVPDATVDDLSQVLIEAHNGDIQAVATSPIEPFVAIAGHSSLLQIMDYEAHTLVMSRVIDADPLTGFGGGEGESSGKDTPRLSKHASASSAAINVRGGGAGGAGGAGGVGGMEGDDESAVEPEGAALQVLTYDPTGLFLVVGTGAGALDVLDASTLETTPHGHFVASKGSITHVVFSKCSTYIAAGDADNCVAIFRATPATVAALNRAKADAKAYAAEVAATAALSMGSARAVEEAKGRVPRPSLPHVSTTHAAYEYVGRFRSHYAPIVGLEFGLAEDSSPRLVSLGADRHLVEYDLANSSVTGGVAILAATKIEETAVPTGLWWHHDGVYVVADSEYKFKVLTTDRQPMVRSTLLAPTYGLPVNTLVPIPVSQGFPEFVAYGTPERVIGLVKLPLDGNPNKGMGLIAQPGAVTSLAVSHDGKYVFSAGGGDLSVNQWLVSTGALDIQAALGGVGVDPFAALIEGGKDGPFYEDMKDYFYYAQILTQGENTTAERDVGDYVHVDRLPDIMRALGFYPTEFQVDNMINQVRFSEWDLTARERTHLDFEELVTIYVNHRPVFDVGHEDISGAFESLGAEQVTGLLARERLFSFLQSRGEAMSEQELLECLAALVADTDIEDVLGAHMTPTDFAERVLGFDPPAANEP